MTFIPNQEQFKYPEEIFVTEYDNVMMHMIPLQEKENMTMEVATDAIKITIGFMQVNLLYRGYKNTFSKKYVAGVYYGVHGNTFHANKILHDDATMTESTETLTYV